MKFRYFILILILNSFNLFAQKIDGKVINQENKIKISNVSVSKIDGSFSTKTNKKGQFTTRKGLMFALAKSVYHTGIETTDFLTKPFDLEFKSFPDDVVEIYGLTVENLLKTTIK